MNQEHEDIVWQGQVYRRWPNSDNRSQRVYFMSTTGPRDYLHRAVYRHHFGAIPAGWHVHHRDHDPANNDPANLVAVHPDEHLSYHGQNHARRVVECAGCGEVFVGQRRWAKWCSPACKERARRRNGLVKPKPRRPYAEARACADCGAEFVARKPWARFCAPACKQRHARRAA